MMTNQIIQRNSMIDKRIPGPLRPVLEIYISLVHERRPRLLHAFYIVGSVALGGFNERFSDIDFVAVLNHKASPIDIESLRAIHKSIERDFPTWKMSGGYLQFNDLGHFEHQIQPHPGYHDGKFYEEGYFEINSVTWWILKNHGIAILGEQPKDLPFTVDWDLLVVQMRDNLNSYWRDWTRNPYRFLILLSDWGIQWAVLGVLRQYYTFRENSITTKLGAGDYALTCLPHQWHPLIQQAMNIREGKKVPYYHSRLLRMIDAVKFLKYVIQVSNQEFINVTRE